MCSSPGCYRNRVIDKTQLVRLAPTCQPRRQSLSDMACLVYQLCIAQFGVESNLSCSMYERGSLAFEYILNVTRFGFVAKFCLGFSGHKRPANRRTPVICTTTHARAHALADETFRSGRIALICRIARACSSSAEGLLSFATAQARETDRQTDPEKLSPFVRSRSSNSSCFSTSSAGLARHRCVVHLIAHN